VAIITNTICTASQTFDIPAWADALVNFNPSMRMSNSIEQRRPLITAFCFAFQRRGTWVFVFYIL
jgi:hypothetical protein